MKLVGTMQSRKSGRTGEREQMMLGLLLAAVISTASGFQARAPPTEAVHHHALLCARAVRPAPPSARKAGGAPRSLLAGVRGLRSTGTEPEALEAVGADGHPIRVWRKGPASGKPILLLHGRTWSARPVWDLQVGSPARDGASELGASTMDLLAAHGYQSWAPDFRGLGGTTRDAGGWTTPATCLADVKAVLGMMEAEGIRTPPLIGWSQGAMVAQMVAQQYPESISHVVLYASIFDPELQYPLPGEKDSPGRLSETPPHVDNTMEGAMEDWTVPGLIDDEAAQAFGDGALRGTRARFRGTGSTNSTCAIPPWSMCPPSSSTAKRTGTRPWTSRPPFLWALQMGTRRGG